MHVQQANTGKKQKQGKSSLYTAITMSPWWQHRQELSPAANQLMAHVNHSSDIKATKQTHSHTYTERERMQHPDTHGCGSCGTCCYRDHKLIPGVKIPGPLLPPFGWEKMRLHREQGMGDISAVAQPLNQTWTYMIHDWYQGGRKEGREKSCGLRFAARMLPHHFPPHVAK